MMWVLKDMQVNRQVQYLGVNGIKIVNSITKCV